MDIASKSAIEKRTDIHRSLIKSIDRHSFKFDGYERIPHGTKEALHQYVTRTAKELGHSIDALLLDGPTLVEFWHKELPWCCAHFGKPITSRVVDGYTLKPEWTYPEGGRFGIAVASHPVIMGRDSKGEMPLRLRLVEGEHTRVDTRGIMLQSAEGVVIRLRPEKEECTATIASCVDRQHAPATYDRWFTRLTQHGTGLQLKSVPPSESENPGGKYEAILPNGWTVIQDTPRLNSYDRWHPSLSHQQEIIVRRDERAPPLPLQAAWQLAKGGIEYHVKIFLNGTEISRIEYPISVRDRHIIEEAERPCYSYDMDAQIRRTGVLHLAYAAREQDARWKRQQASRELRIRLPQEKEYIKPLNQLLRQIAQYANAATGA